MERTVASESLKHFLGSPSLHPYLSPFLPFFPSFLPPSLFLFFLPFSLFLFLELAYISENQKQLN